MNCDSVARVYRWLEYLRFGRTLEQCRFAMLPKIKPVKNVLLVGDGDGRFLEKLTKQWSGLHIDSVDNSARMLQLAKKRLSSDGKQTQQQVRFCCADIRTINLPNYRYELIACHFVFDVFSTADLQPIIDRIAKQASSNAQWIVSEFDVPPKGWFRIVAQLWISLMYRFFRVMTGLTNQTLPNWRPALAQAGFILTKRLKWKQGFIVSELWERKSIA